MELVIIMLSEISQTQTSITLPAMCEIWIKIKKT
jgi:hypothetical protein